MGKIKGWKKVRENKKEVVYFSKVKKLNLVVFKTAGGWKVSSSVNMLHPTKQGALKSARFFMRSRPNG